MKSGYVLVLMTAFIAGFSIWINKFGVSDISPFVYTGTRNILVALLLFTTIIFLGNFKKLKGVSKKELKYLLIIGVVGGGIPFLLYFYGLSITSATKAAFIHKMMFVFVGVMAFFFLKERLSKKQIVAGGGLLVGLFFLTGTPNAFDFGALLVLIATLLWAVENVISKHVLNLKMDPIILAFGRMFFGSLIIFSFLILTGDVSKIMTLNLEQVLWILGPLVLLYGYVVTWYYGISKIQVSEATAILILGSAVTSLLDLTSSSITLEKLLGMVLIITSVALIVLSSARISKHVKGVIQSSLKSIRKSS